MGLIKAMAGKEIILTTKIRKGIEKLEFDDKGAKWRVVLARKTEMPDQDDREIKKYTSAEDAWNDIDRYRIGGFKIILVEE
jgi:mRNA-degrading endonuclease RelE of RelBE toxin-antitoxin system